MTVPSIYCYRRAISAFHWLYARQIADIAHRIILSKNRGFYIAKILLNATAQEFIGGGQGARYGQSRANDVLTRVIHIKHTLRRNPNNARVALTNIIFVPAAARFASYKEYLSMVGCP